MGQNEVGYLKGVLTRSGTWTDREEMENTKSRQDTVSFSGTASAHNSRSSCSFREMHWPGECEMAYMTPFPFEILASPLKFILNPSSIRKYQ